MVERRIMRTPRPVSNERQKILHFTFLPWIPYCCKLYCFEFKCSHPSLGPQWSSFVLRRNGFAWRKDQVGELLIMMKDGFQKQTQSKMQPWKGKADLRWCPGRENTLAAKRENITFDLLSCWRGT